jgi:ribose-phosphate pyrophosphokinase
MISTGGSIVGAVNVARQHGARKVYVGAAHGLFCGPAIERLSQAAIDEIVVTDSLPQSVSRRLGNVHVVSVAPLLGEAIRRIHRNESVSRLFD